uniref:CUE domain containing 1b n=1 Tax=Callorhinchus milii TaxID=7868 RepID=A0A4W3J4I4_CALMI
MTSLFRRNSSNGGSKGSSPNVPSSQVMNNSRPARQVRRLEFNQAMEDFKVMFPNMDYDVIECVLRANNGAVDATIDQLLQMNLDCGFDNGYDDSSDSEDSIPPEILERTLEPDSSDEEPPPVYSPPSYDMHIYDRQYPQVAPLPPCRQPQRRYRNWNPPLLGNLPDDFLRILPQQLDTVQVSGENLPERPKIKSSSGNSQKNGRQSLPGDSQASRGSSLEQERKLKQYLEDERIALFLQNEEFMKELQRNREFLLALEKGEGKGASGPETLTVIILFIAVDSGASGAAEASSAVCDDALFRDKLKHMGKSTRKKLFELARAFSEKTKMRKLKRKHSLKHHTYPLHNRDMQVLQLCAEQTRGSVMRTYSKLELADFF